MTKSQKTALIRQNCLCWATAVVVPIVFHYGLAGTRFPWPIVLPILWLAPMMVSNSLISKAAGPDADESDGR